MFATVYFKEDEQLDCVNVKKLSRKDGTSEKLEILSEVTAPYKTTILDEAGIEKLVNVDYDGLVVFLDKDKSEVASFIKKKGEIIKALKEGTLTQFVSDYKKTKHTSKRVGKKSEKFLTYLESENEGKDQVSPTKKRKSNKKSNESKSNGGEKKIPVKESDKVKEAQRVQAVEYFRRKSVTPVVQEIPISTMASRSPIQEKTLPIPSIAVQESLNCTLDSATMQGMPSTSSLSSVICTVQGTISSTDSSATALVQLQGMTSTHKTFDSPSKNTRSKTSNASNMFLQNNDEYQSTVVNNGCGSPPPPRFVAEQGPSFVSSAVGESYRALLFSETENSGCNQCFMYQAELEQKNIEIQQLNHELQILRGKQINFDVSDDRYLIIKDLKSLVNKWDKPDLPAEPPTPQRAVARGTISEENYFNESFASHTDKDEGILTPKHISKAAVTSHKKGLSFPSVPGPDVLASVKNSDIFFQPGENKVKLIESYDLYIDVTKLHAMRHRNRKNPSRFVRDILTYYFEPEYLAQHSATGLKSLKKGLPTEILLPVREYLQKNFKMEDINGIINRKCLDIARFLNAKDL